MEANYDTVDTSYLPDPANHPERQDKPTHYDFNALIKEESAHESHRAQAQASHHDWLSHHDNAPQFAPSHHAYHPDQQFLESGQTYRQFSAPTDQFIAQTSSSTSSSNPFSTESKGAAHFQTKVDSKPYVHHESGSEWHRQLQEQPLVTHSEWVSEQSGLPITSSAHGYLIDDDDDDPFDVSEDDVPMENPNFPGMWQDDFSIEHLRNNDLGIVVALQASQETPEMRLRTFTSFIDRPDMLASYVPSPQATPLQDSTVARLFCHFVNVTGPAMNMFERHPANPALIFQGRPVPLSQQHIWTCEL